MAITLFGLKRSMNQPAAIVPMPPPSGNSAVRNDACWIEKPASFISVGIQLVSR
ncbi:hypothetical protein D3C72_1994490 [compost metagenome]